MASRRRIPSKRRAGAAHAARTSALGVLAAIALAGCASLFPASPAPDGPDAVPTTAIDCRTEGTWMLPEESETPDPSIPEPGRVPEGFEPVAALRCSFESGPSTEDDATEGGPVIQVERFEGDLAPLLAALAEPDDAVPADIACTADMELVPPLWLEASDGSLIPVHYPRDACGKTKAGVHDALAGLEVVAVTDQPARPSGE
ncbi:hypothetical protein GE115_03085 [Agromyces sp. CFH 90414]|uniref:DUF3558 domain-containing protein n=1 Tax=Agromyces agglutinans TaxID=2662258 RepID=A0A6I2F2U5_9MICO|nr:hypothetical protein [Agromyces agglutinans]MRG58859.1 hypothetical protein [Agromyces agglutinans]